MLRILRRSLVVAAAFWAVLATVAAVVVLADDDTPPAPAATADQGAIHLVRRTQSDFDRYTSHASAATRDWMNAKLWRAVVYAPYFDNKVKWFPNGWSYRDLYGLPVGSPLVRRHPEWILRDAGGKRLYLSWGCANGTCPQYAADPGNAAFRRYWIGQARNDIANGYRGLWIDDVNLDLRVGDGAGKLVHPVRSGRTMNDEAWRHAIAGFTVAIRRAVPKAEIVHNAIWYAAGPRRLRDTDVEREVRAADLINLERGVNDDGLTGGDGEWSLNAFLSHVDQLHAMGRGAIFESWATDLPSREYNLASYLLVSNGHDGVGAPDVTPDRFWDGYSADLGAASGARRTWNGLLRRDFAHGLALVNPPQAETVTVDLGHAYQTTSGATVTRVTLAAGRGAVLRG